MDKYLTTESEALSELIEAGWVFLINTHPVHRNRIQTDILVGCNDMFAGCADAEDLPFEEIPKLYALWEQKKGDGVIKWVCLRRNEQPQKPIKEQMIKDGTWDDDLEKLPVNHYWKMIEEKYGNKT